MVRDGWLTGQSETLGLLGKAGRFTYKAGGCLLKGFHEIWIRIECGEVILIFR
jgi:hypothetical protein